MTDWLIPGPPGGGNYNPTFDSGEIWYQGAYGPTTNIQLEYGTALPNPSGQPAACLLLGSGGGGGTNIQAWYITDEAYDVNTPGNDIGATAGETQPGSTQRGGNYTTIAGASDGGAGGVNTVQGGTSAQATAGDAVLAGGNATGLTGAAIPGDAIVIAGQEGQTGANAQLIATLLNGIAGEIFHKLNSVHFMDELPSASTPGNFGLYLYNGGGLGNPAGAALTNGASADTVTWQSGFSGTITTAKLTTGGTEGSMTFVCGILASQVAAT